MHSPNSLYGTVVFTVAILHTHWLPSNTCAYFGCETVHSKFLTHHLQVSVLVWKGLPLSQGCSAFSLWIWYLKNTFFPKRANRLGEVAEGEGSLTSPSPPLSTHYHCSSCHHQDLINEHRQGPCCLMTLAGSSRGEMRTRAWFRTPRPLWQLQLQLSQPLSHWTPAGAGVDGGCLLWYPPRYRGR